MNSIIPDLHRTFVLLAAATVLFFSPAPFAAAQSDKRTSPPMAGGFPALTGTAWKIDFGNCVTGTQFQFYKNGRWEIVPSRAGSIGAVGKSYKVSGSTLQTVNADDGMVQNWKMTWKSDVLELFDGKATLRLHYQGETQS